jgi:hypothetical protein
VTKKKDSILSRLSPLAYLFMLAAVVIVVLIAWQLGFFHPLNHYVQDTNTKTSTVAITAPVVGTSTIPVAKELEDGYYVTQTRNNCGPSALSMDLSYYGIHVDQETLADDLRPTHSEGVAPDDKSTTPEEIVGEIQKYGLTAYYRPDGNVQELKEFIANGIPVITRTLFLPTEDFGHYRVIKGYNDATQTITDEDGFTGPEVNFSYTDFMSLWQEYNYEYIVIVPPGKDALVQSIIGQDMDTQTAWQNAATVAQTELTTDTGAAAISAGFNLSVADYYLGDYADSVAQFEKVEPELPVHKMWYQMEPIESYYELGDYNQVFSLSNTILTDGDPIYPELLVLLGNMYEKQNNLSQAKAEFQQALVYNKNLVSAQQALAALGS